MSGDRWRRIALMLEHADPAIPVGERIGAVARELLDAQHTSLALVTDRSASTILGSDAHGVLLDEQQFALGEGPTFDAIDSFAPVVGDDLAGPACVRRWPAFAALATIALLQEQSDAVPGDLADAFVDGLYNQSQIPIAAGMVSEQLGISILDALVRLRGHAYRTGQRVNAIARSVVARELVLDG